VLKHFIRSHFSQNTSPAPVRPLPNSLARAGLADGTDRRIGEAGQRERREKRGREGATRAGDAGTAWPATLFVDLNYRAPAAPYTNWATAATHIQDAVDAAVAGDEILVTNGVYQIGARAVHGMSNRVAVTKPVLVRSVNGSAVTGIVGSGRNGPNAARCVYLTNGAQRGKGLFWHAGLLLHDAAADGRNRHHHKCAVVVDTNGWSDLRLQSKRRDQTQRRSRPCGCLHDFAMHDFASHDLVRLSQ
jgi:hypothetical protein